MRGNRALLDVEEYGARLDWATFSALPDAADRADFHAFGRDFMARNFEHVPERTEKRIGAYSGECVSATSFVRRNHDGHEMLVATGEESNRLVEEVIIHNAAGKFTRIDSAVTARATRPYPNYPERVRAIVGNARRKAGLEQRQAMGLFDSKHGSTGVTVGSRSSAIYGRIYDWDAKHGDGAKFQLWRHEVEFKAECAQRFVEGYAKEPNRALYCATVVKRQMEKWLIPCQWLNSSDGPRLVGGKERTTNQKRLQYIEKVMCPMVLKLCQDGHTEELRALFDKYCLSELIAPAYSGPPE